MSQYPIVIRRSPFLFLKRLVFIEVFFALLPFAAAAAFNLFFGNLSDLYTALPFAGSIPFYLFIVLLVTTLQILIVVVAFVTWYVPIYLVDEQEIVHQRGTMFPEKTLAEIADIEEVSIKQGVLAKRFDYGSLQLLGVDGKVKGSLRDIPDPAWFATLLQTKAEDEADDVVFTDGNSVAQIVSRGERQQVEFKSSFLWDYHQQRANKALHVPVMKTLAAFMNSSGGWLLIGVDDDGRALGLEPDLQTLRAPTVDAFEISFNAAFNKMIGAEFRQFVDVSFPELEQTVVCLIKVHRSPQPIYLSEKGMEKFYIRAGNASQSLTISQSNWYIKQRF